MSDFFIRSFLQVAEISMQAGVAVLCVIVAGVLLRLTGTPRKYTYLLWSIPFLRLLLPVVPSRRFSLFPGEEQVSARLQPLLQEPVRYISGNVTDGATVLLNDEIDTGLSSVEQITVNMGANTPMDWQTVLPGALTVVWLAGMLVILGYSIMTVVRLERQLRMHVPVQKGVYAVDGIPSAFVMGLHRAKVYIPSQIAPENLEYVLAHEREHIRRKDHIVKPVAFLLCAIYWFQPLVWLGYLLFCRDMELACDEGVIEKRQRSYRREYAAALLDLSVERKSMGPVPLAFSEGNPKKRIKSIVAYRKSGVVAIIAGVVVLGVLAVLILSRPDTGGQEMQDTLRTMENLQSGLTAAAQVQTNKISVTVPVVDLEASTGADGVQLHYGDSERLIVSGYFGLFVYSMEERKILRGLDLAAIECQYTQGDKYCEIMVSDDGNIVYLHPMHMEDMYVYHVQENTLYREPYDLTGVELYTGVQGQGYVTYRENDRERSIMLASDWNAEERSSIGAAGYYIDGSFFHPLFKEELYPDAVYFEPEDLYDLVKIEMRLGDQVYSTDKEDALDYIEKYLGSCKKDIRGAGCPFYDPMYLTRADGVVGIIYPATDSCSTFCTGTGGCYDYTPGYGNNEEFWKLIGDWNRRY